MKLRLLQALHIGRVGPGSLDALFWEMLAAAPNPTGTWDAMSAMNGKWHLLGASRPGSSGAAVPRLALYSGKAFAHEGSIHNGGLFKAVLETQAADVKLGTPEVRLADGKMVVSVVVAASSGRTKTLTYTAELTPTSPKRFRRNLLSLELPGPVGTLTPLLELHDSVVVAYRDDDLLILQDESGQLEFLVHESVRLDGTSDIWDVERAFLQVVA
mmetsp:Transcript_264/g.619  ORF Transcript_264/g.619 Transcript_264/m.619 type:complete len:214 (+) Transcript_264:1-642(+)